MDTIYYSATANGFYGSDHPSRPADCIEITADEHVALLDGQAQGRIIRGGADGRPELVDRPGPTPAELQASLTAAVQHHLDAQAQALGYDSLASAASYADEPAVPTFQAEGRALRAWRSLVWAECVEMLTQVNQGQRDAPTVPELLAALPAFPGA